MTTTVVDDLFDEASLTQLTAHTPNTGATWVVSGPVEDFRVGAGAGYAYAYAGFSRVRNTAALTVTDWDVFGYFDRVSSGAFPSFRIFGQATTGGECYELIMSHYGDWVRLFKATAWGTSGTHVAEWTGSLPATTTDMQLQKRGNVIKAFVNGVERISYTDGAPLTGGTLTGFGFDGAGVSEGRILRFLATDERAGGDTTPPVITGPGGATGATSSVSVAENTTAVHTFTADEAVTWSLNGGADAALFSIGSSTGALAFLSAPNFESPSDADTNNTYVVVVRATDSATNTTDQTVTVTVTDVGESSGATLSSSPIKDNTGTLHLSAPFEAFVSNPTTGVLTVKKTGLTSHATTGVVSFTDAALAAATSYRVVWRRTDTGAEGLETLTAS